ncbi:MAG: hypothetical protein Fur0026_06740 [Sideroxydans sp.]
MKKLAILLLCLLMAQAVCAAELFGTVDAVSGEATVAEMTGAHKPVTLGLQIFAGQSIQTAADGEVHIVTEDSGLIALRPNSSFRIDRYQAKGKSSDEINFSLFKGALRSITGWIAKRNRSAYRLKTPNATIGVRGTDHETTVIDVALDGDQPGTFDTVYEGVTVMQSPRGEIEVRPGEHAFAPRDGAVAPRLLAQRPGFLQRRALRIEERIQQRKEHLSPLVQHRLQERIGDMRDDPGKRKVKNHREEAKKKLEQRRPRERRNP